VPKVVYVTGAPAAGKSSTLRALAERLPGLLTWEYGARLTEHVTFKAARDIHQHELREKSAGLVTPEDVSEVDRQLLQFVEINRGSRNVLIDSHPVTKEDYGFRITPFSSEQVAALRPDEIWVLYASPEETRRRIEADGAGRPMITAEEAAMHTFLQTSVAATYGIAASCPVYIFDTNASREDLMVRLIGRLS
jgi:adenylate kinase